MYQIICDGSILFDVRDDELKVYNPKLNLEVNKAGALSFTIYNRHPYYSSLKKLTSVVQVFREGVCIWKGRIRTEKAGFYLEKSIECEGKLAFLNDSKVRPFEFKGSPEEMFRWLINTHNSQVSRFQQFKIGNITVKDKNDYISRSSDKQLSTWETLKTRLLDLSGGYVYIRYEQDGDYIDYLADFKTKARQPIRFGENLLDIVTESSASETYTAMVPVGAEVDGSRIDISSVNNGLDYIINTDRAAEFGVIYAPEDVSTWDDVTLPANLLAKAQAWLTGTGIKFKDTIEVTAIDLNLTDQDIESFSYCEYVEIESEPHGLEAYYLLSKLLIDIGEPQNTKLTLGETKLSLGALGTKIDAFEQNYVKNTDLSSEIETVAQKTVNESMEGYVASDNVVQGDHVEITKENNVITIAAVVPTKTSELENDSDFITPEGAEPVIQGILNNMELPAGPEGKSAYELAAENGYAGTKEDWLASLQGKNGTDGADGLAGKEGPAGVDGKDGNDGLPGKDGKDGTDGLPGADGTVATISVGTVETGAAGSQATVENSGTETVAVLNFTIPQGLSGKDGANGKDGIDGLPGKDGKDGTDGLPGADGVNPVKGVDYFTAAEIKAVEDDLKSYCDTSISNAIGTLNTELQNTLKGVT